MLTIVQAALEAGFLYAPIALALFLSFSILNIADMTTDGAFVLGSAVSAMMCLAGHPILALPAGMAASAAAGFITAFLQTKLAVPSILAGIVTNIGLYSINLMVMGKSNQSLFQGFFLAPTVTAAALKGAIFAANIYEKLGFAVIPNGTESRHDIIQAVTFGKPEGVIAFCQGIQAAAPVDSFVSPEPWAMPGYDSDVIMAAGAFVQGSSIELSADGPIKPPYAVYFQGGLTWQHAKLGILMSLQKMTEAGCVKLQ